MGVVIKSGCGFQCGPLVTSYFKILHTGLEDTKMGHDTQREQTEVENKLKSFFRSYITVIPQTSTLTCSGEITGGCKYAKDQKKAVLSNKDRPVSHKHHGTCSDCFGCFGYDCFGYDCFGLFWV